MKPESAKAFQKANKSKVQLTEETVHADDTLPCCSSLRQYTAEEKKLCIVRGMNIVTHRLL